jgi:hypothetical protein
MGGSYAIVSALVRGHTVLKSTGTHCPAAHAGRFSTGIKW